MFSLHRARCHLATKPLRKVSCQCCGNYHIVNPGERLGSFSAQDGLERVIKGDPQCSRSLATFWKSHRQNLGPVPAHQPILKTVENKNVLAFFEPGNGQCDVQAVIWNVDEIETNPTRVRISLYPGQSASIDSSATESFKLRCGDHAEALVAIDGDRQFASK